LQLLSPGYAALMPFMLAPKSDITISQWWMEKQNLNNLLLNSTNSEFVDGEFRNI